MIATKIKKPPRTLSPLKLSEDPFGKADEILRDLRPQYQQLQEILEKHRQDYFLPHYDIGELVIEARDAIKAKHGSTYGAQVVDVLAEAVGRNSRTVYSCVQLVETLTREEYLDMISCDKISWEHVLLLLSVSLPSERAKFVEQVKEHGWTTAELQAKVHLGKPSRQTGSGRQHAVPRDVSIAVHRLLKATDSYGTLTNDVIFGHRFDIPTALRAMATEDVSVGLRDSIVSAANKLDQLATAAAENARRLRSEALVFIDEVLAAQDQPKPETKEDSHGAE